MARTIAGTAEVVKVAVEKLSPGPGDLVVLHLPDAGAVSDVCDALHEWWRRAYPGAHCMLLPPGCRVECLGGESLAGLGLARVDRPAVVDAPGGP